ncbi:DUF4040 domain-containing protein [Haloarchaeobius salinus]|uniref:DUF4040 domain-containing protein n=1 Tax=Haloarchaeobius salinus TaxID=1198298 RepID=UPI00210CD578|nr:DUF4040 domain-containing protein [Haloarchaeobius salinus]
MSTAIGLVLLAFVLACAVATAVLRDVLGSVIAFGAYSLGLAAIWVLLQAPDVGLTEAAVGAGLVIVLYLITIAKTVRPTGERVIERIDVPAVVVSVALVAVLLSTVGALPPVGAEAPSSTGDVSTYYLENAYEEIGVTNAVTAVLAGYRGFDTLGEAVVVYTAGVGILVALRQGVSSDE